MSIDCILQTSYDAAECMISSEYFGRAYAAATAAMTTLAAAAEEKKKAESAATGRHFRLSFPYATAGKRTLPRSAE